MPVRPKHMPLRTCIGCRAIHDKRSMVRIVRTPDGHIQIDPTGKQSGRGAYLCGDPACLALTVRMRKLERALHASIDRDAEQRLFDDLARCQKEGETQ